MARTAPVPNFPAIPGMNPGIFVMGGGGDGGGSGAGNGKGKGKGQGADGKNGGKDANGGEKGAGNCGAGTGDGGGCPNHHGPGSSGGLTAGDPVDVVTGRVFTVPVVDVSFPGPLPLILERTYSSFARDADVGLGPGWSHSLAWHVLVRRGSVRVRTADGMEHLFGRVPDGGAVMGPHGWLLHREGAGFRLEIGDGTRLFFDAVILTDEGERHLLTTMADQAKNRIVLAYDQGLLAEVTDAFGRVVRVARGPGGRVAAFETKNAVAQGRWVALARFLHDEGGRLVEARDADGAATRYTYDDEDRLTSYTLATGLTFFFRYDAAGRCVETWGEYPGRADPSLAADLQDTLADDKTKAKGIFHTLLDFSGDGYSEVTTSVAVHRYFGNSHGLVDKAVTPLGVFERTFDERGFVTSFTDPLGAITRWKRDHLGRETEVVDPLGRTTVVERDLFGEITSVTEPDGSVTRVARQGSSLIWTDPLGATCSVRYDEHGLPSEVAWPDGRTRVFQRDAHGNAIELVDENGAVTRARYDEWGRCVEVWDARGGRTGFSYSDGGRLLATVSPDGSTQRFGHDGVGNITAFTDADGATTRIQYGGLHKVVRIEKPNGEVQALTYNREGWLLEVRNGRGERHTFERSAAGLVVAERTFDGRTLRHGYDEMGRLVWSKNGLGERTEFVRDAAGQLVARSFEDGTEETFEYNARGEIIAATNEAGSFRFDRNARGWITREVQEAGGRAIRVENEFLITGEIAARRTSLGHEARWAYDHARHAVAVSLDGQPAALSVKDALGREILRTLPSGARIETGYDAFGRLASRRVAAGGAAAGQGSIGGEPSWVGRLPPGTLFADMHRHGSTGLLLETWSSRRGAAQLDYDPAGQLSRLSREGRGSRSFRYDLSGNLHDATPGAAPRSYGAGDRIERAGDTLYMWDADGRLCEKVTRDAAGARAVTRYRWSATGMLARVEKPDGTAVAFTYDPFGRRIEKTVSSREASGAERPIARTRFVWDGGALVHELREAAAAAGDPVIEERTYVFEHDRTVPFAHRDVVTRDGARAASPWWHYLNDDSGAPEVLLGPDGEIACELVRDPWGAASAADGALTTTPIRFRGQYADDETGLSYNRYRYHDPEIGRYIRTDPIGIEGGLNAFAYAGNCPPSAVDVEGLMYTVIKDAQGNVVADGHSQDTHRPMPAPHSAVPGGKPCAERNALTSFANTLGPNATQADVAKHFQEKGYKIETYEGNADDYRRGKRVAANPCSVCKQMFSDMGIPASAIQGHSPKNLQKVGPWNGESTYNPATNKIFRNL